VRIGHPVECDISRCEVDQVETAGLRGRGRSLGEMRHRHHHNPQRDQYSESERCSDQECAHFVPSHYLRAPPIGRPRHPYAIESATIAAGVVSLTGLPNWSQKKRTNYGFNSIRHRWGLQ
jgi:hypothetical protein